MTTGNRLNDEIRIRGVMRQGFGQLAKIVMLDRDLTIEAKGIYAYFVSYTGAGCSTAFPSRDRILHDLKVSKDTYYKHFNLLLANGYISVEQQKDSRFCRNIYTVENCPEKFSTFAQGEGDAFCKAAYDVRYHGDISAAGYGNVPKSVMTDTSLSLQAKALYAYLCVWTGQDMNSTPSRDIVLYHLDITHSTYNKYIRQLLDMNYVTRTTVTAAGRFSGIMYHLNTTVAKPDESPEAKISDTVKPDAVIQDTEISDTVISDAKIPDTAKPEAEIPDTVIQDTNITSINKTKTNKTSIYHNQSSRTGKGGRTDKINMDSVIISIAETGGIPESCLCDKKQLRAAVDIISGSGEPFCSTGSDSERQAKHQAFNLFKEAMCEILNPDAQPFSACGAKVFPAEVYSALGAVLETGFSTDGQAYATLGGFPDFVVLNYMKQFEHSEIKSHKAYMKAVIWTCLTTVHISDYAKLVHDFGCP